MRPFSCALPPRMEVSGDGSGPFKARVATSAAGASERAIMNQTGHKSLTVLRGYIRDGRLFAENAAAMLGL